MPRPRRIDQPALGRPDDILSQVPNIEYLEAKLAETELEAARIRTLLAAVRQMSGSRQPLPAEDFAVLEETA